MSKEILDSLDSICYFGANGEIYGEGVLSELLTKHSDQERADTESLQDFGLAVAAEHDLVEQA